MDLLYGRKLLILQEPMDINVKLQGGIWVKFYQPSGKISGWFYLYFLICAAGIVPLFAYGYTFAEGYIIRKKLKIIFFIVCVVIMEFYCQDFVIQKGKVRNYRAAVWSALMFSIVFVAVSCIASKKFYGNYGDIWSRGIQFLSLTLLMIAGFVAAVAKPFCEESGKWAREFCIYFELPDNTASLLQKLITNEESAINELKVVPFSYDSQSGKKIQAIMEGHLLFELWTTGGTSEFYLTVVKKTAKQGRGGRIHYSEEELVRYMAINRELGIRLFSYAGNGENRPLFINIRENRVFSLGKLWGIMKDGMSVALLVLMYTQLKGQFGGRIPMQVFYFYGGSVFLISLLSLAGCFIKEPVVRSEQLERDESLENRVRYIEMADSGLRTKLYYTTLLLGSMGYLAAAVFYSIG